MKLSLEQFRERLVDYLYGSLEGDELRDFEQCLAESEVCRRELSTMQSTLRTARQELARSASEPGPGVRDAVLAAATVEARALAAAARERKSQRPSLRPPRSVGESSALWAWLRAPWLLPTLGVAAAVAVVVLSKDVESPAPQRASQPTQQAPAAPSPPPASPERAPAAAVRESAPEQRAAPAPHPSQPERPGALRSRSSTKGYAEPPAALSAQDRVYEESSGDLSGSGSAAPEKRVAASKAAAEPEREEADPARLQAQEPRAVAPGSAAGGGAGKASAPASGEPARHRAPSRVAASRDETRPAATAAESRPQGALGDASAESELLEKLASAHLAAGRFERAGETYRELLARFPRDPQVPVWKRRLALAEQALARDAGR